MKLATNLEFRKYEIKTFKGNDGKDLSLQIITWITEDEEVIRTTPVKDVVLDLASLQKGKMYTVFLSTDKLALVSSNDLATLYQVKFKVDSISPFELKGGNK